jgi:class 3 adenylate cyclase
MSARPETRYANSGDVMIAYQVVGEDSQVDLVWCPGGTSHLEIAWDVYPEHGAYFGRLAERVRLIRFDKRGTGMSDRPTDRATLEEQVDDVRAVMDAAGSQRAFLWGNSDGGNLACLFAATHPARTVGLILWGAMARWTPAPGHPWGIPPEQWEASASHLERFGADDDYIRKYDHVTSEDEMIRLRRAYRMMASPAAHAAEERAAIYQDVRAVLPQIHVPTLVMNRTGDPWSDVEGARDLASRIEGARFIELPGNTHDYTDPDPDRVIAEILEFVTGTRPAPPAERVLATILFTDIVGSTALAAELGDARWKGRLAAHDRVAAAEIARHRGRLVRSTGDGIQATFDGPARAVRCAQAIAEGVRTLGLETRAGCHTGEIELVDDHVEGIAVHIGARVAALAGPSEVWVSSTVKDLTAGSGLVFEDRGEHELKGVPDRWHLYRVATPGQARG